MASWANVPHVVPEADHRPRRVVLISQGAETRRLQQKISSRGRRQSQPSRGQNSQEMSAGKEQHIPVNSPHALNDAIGPRADLLRRFAPRRTIAKQIPARILEMDVGAGSAVV